MKMDTDQIQKLIEGGSGIGGIVGILALVFFVFQGQAEPNVIVTALAALASGAGAYGAGKKSGERKGNPQKPDFSMIKGELKAEVGNTIRDELRSAGIKDQGTIRNVTKIAEDLIEHANYAALQKVGGKIDGVNGSAKTDQIRRELRSLIAGGDNGGSS